MTKQQVKENNFEGGVAGTAGSVNTQPGYGTPNYSSQNPDDFYNSNNNKALGPNSNTAKNSPSDRSTEKDINYIYSKKKTPTPDEISSGIKYEMSQQIKKDKSIAKQEVLKNLRKRPDFYSGLHQLNIDDQDLVSEKTVNMKENKHPNDAPARSKVTANVTETKKIFTEMAKNKDEKYVVNAGICDVMKKMWVDKKKRSQWKHG